MISGNTISGNTTSGLGGGIDCDNTGSVSVLGNTIWGNKAARGAGIGCSGTGTSVAITGNLIYGNTAGSDSGGGIGISNGATVTVTNCTISGNKAPSGGGIRSYGTSVTLSNCIISFATGGGGILWDAGAAPVVKYCDVYGNTGGNYVHLADQTGKSGNLSKNPLFYNAAVGNFYEKSKGGRWNLGTKAWVIDTVQSPCIDAGNPASSYV